MVTINGKEIDLNSLPVMSQEMIDGFARQLDYQYGLYKRAGCPYGHTHEGLNRWRREQHEKQREEMRNAAKRD